MKTLRALVAVLLVVVMCTAVFAATAPKLAKEQEMSYNLNTEPEIIDPHRSTGVPEMNVEINCLEGLTRTGENDRPIPGTAESWTISKDGLVYTFKIRENAKWSNGDPLTADDFEYSWKRMLSPKLAAEYAYQGYYIKNAEAYNTGKITDPNLVGVKATDPHTLVVTLENPCPYFLSIAYFPALFPVHKATVEANPEKWAASPETYIGNGPFIMTSWTHQQKIEFAPNPNYWNRAKVKLTKLTFYLIEDQNTALTMFETGQLDFDRDLPNQELPRLTSEKILKFGPELATYYYMFNVTKPPFNDVRVRKALTYGIDRATLIKYVVKGGQKPALALVPGGVPDAAPKAEFRQVGGNYYKDNDITLAKKLLAEAGYPNGKGFPEFEILYNTSANHKMIAEAIQEMWKKNLNINCTIVNQEWQVVLDMKDNLQYSVARAGWVGDYVDPMTFMDMFVTNGGNNDTGWSNAKYDKLIDTAKSTGDQKVRMKAMHDAEKILMTEMPIMPVYFYTRPYVMKDYIKNVKDSALNMIDYSEAYVLAH